jgi:putative ABC transport system permease protein
MFFLRLALLSILTHRRRSAIIVLSVLVSVVFMILVEGMLGGLRTSFFEDLLQQSGHLQIHAKGWETRLDPYSLAFLLRDPGAEIRRIEGDPLIASRLTDIEPMLEFGALLIHGDRNVAIAGEAVEPSTRFFARVRGNVRSGAFLPTGGSQGAGLAISTGIARLLGLKVADNVVVLVQDATGSPYYLSYPVTGIFESGVQQTDEGLFFISLSDAQRLLDLPHSVSELRLTLKEPDAAVAVARRVSALFPDERPFVQTWRDIQGGLISLINLGDIYSTVMEVIITVVAATVITSSILMTVFERIPTFGTLRAIGLKRRQLFWILLEEGLLLGCMGSVLGMAIGLPLELHLQVHGLNVGAFSRVLGTATTYHFALTMRGAITVFAAGVLIAVGGYLYGAVVSVRTSLLASLEQGV